MNETLKTILERRSVKNYLPRQVEEDKLQAILEAGTYAACGKGIQSTTIVVIQDKQTRDELEKMNAAIQGKPEGKPFYGAPTVCVVLADANHSTGVENGALVIGNMMNAAQSLGVSSCWIHRARQEFQSDEGKALLKKWGLEGEYVGVGHCILGYAAEAPKCAAPRNEKAIVRI